MKRLVYLICSVSFVGLGTSSCATPKSQTLKAEIGTYKFRSHSADFFLCESSSGATLKCISSCFGLVNLPAGGRLEFLDNFQIVEFNTSLGPQSCPVESCREILN